MMRPETGGVVQDPVNLGEIKGSISFVEPIGKKKGTLHIYLVPHDSATNELPEHVFTYSFPDQYNRDNYTKNVLFNFHAIAPGDYIVRAFWKLKRSPAGSSPLQASAGDRVSTNRQPIKVRPGKRTSGVSIDCTSIYRPTGGGKQ